MLHAIGWVTFAMGVVALGRRLRSVGWRALWQDPSSAMLIAFTLYGAGTASPGAVGVGIMLVGLGALARGAYLQDRRNQQRP